MENKCPLCGSIESKFLFYGLCSDFDNSELYNNIVVKSCNSCYHVFNVISKDDEIGINNYYNFEASLINNNSFNKEGDLPGSDNKYTLQRYKDLYKFIEKYLSKDARILDAGCASGGFLKFLKQKGYNNLYGIDIVKYYIDNVPDNIAITNVEDIQQTNFQDEFFDFIILDHVLEHSVSPIKVVSEIERVLNNDGYLYVGVPDATQYVRNYFFPFYWFVLREHLHHFDFNQLYNIITDFKFKFIDKDNFYHKMMSDNMILPNLMTVFQKHVKVCDKKLNTFVLKEVIKNYIKVNESKLDKIRDKINSIDFENNYVFIWGIGKEFFYLYENTKLKGQEDLLLIDKNIIKQNNFTFNNNKIFDPDIISKNIVDNSILIITAIAHSEKIKQEAINLGFKGQIITL